MRSNTSPNRSFPTVRIGPHEGAILCVRIRVGLVSDCSDWRARGPSFAFERVGPVSDCSDWREGHPLRSNKSRNRAFRLFGSARARAILCVRARESFTRLPPTIVVDRHCVVVPARAGARIGGPTRVVYSRRRVRRLLACANLHARLPSSSDGRILGRISGFASRLF